MAKKKNYPATDEVEVEKKKAAIKNNCSKEEPDWIANAPNYDKFAGWTPEEVLVFLNID